MRMRLYMEDWHEGSGGSDDQQETKREGVGHERLAPTEYEKLSAAAQIVLDLFEEVYRLPRCEMEIDEQGKYYD